MLPVQLGLPAESHKRRRSPTPEENGWPAQKHGRELAVALSHPTSDQVDIRTQTHTLPRPMVPLPNPVQRFKQFVGYVFSRTTYGKDLDELLAPEKNFSATLQPNGELLLTNYGESLRTRPPLKGVCNDLAYSFGTMLQNALGSQYEIRVGKGAAREYFPYGTHYFVVVWPKAKHDEVMQAIANKQAFPEGCAIFDPSFKKVVSSKHTEPWDSYKLEKVSPLDEFRPEKIRNSYAPGANLPIGFIRDLAPALVPEWGEKALLYLTLQPNTIGGDMPELRFEVQRDPFSIHMEPAHDILQYLPNTHALKQLHDKLFFDMLFSLSSSTDISPIDTELPEIHFPDLSQILPEPFPFLSDGGPPSGRLTWPAAAQDVAADTAYNTPTPFVAGQALQDSREDAARWPVADAMEPVTEALTKTQGMRQMDDLDRLLSLSSLNPVALPIMPPKPKERRRQA